MHCFRWRIAVQLFPIQKTYSINEETPISEIYEASEVEICDDNEKDKACDASDPSADSDADSKCTIDR